ncbi:hypothetical protein MTR_5g086140 [Medicago truncatula]|uniref:Uncharacterized protein n=1 Tax=Medicago truncatula TaxID=3880 RepID=G7K7N3_MEDTR|nr:hypothetical protein MTR_5g086140 [Medicago truncatula]
MILEKIMRTLSPSIDHVIVEIEDSNDLTTLKIRDLQGSFEDNFGKFEDQNAKCEKL